MNASAAGKLLEIARRLPSSTMTWAMLDQMLVKGSMFVFGLLAARLIGLESFGRLTLVLVLLYLIQELLTVFVNAPMMTIVGRRARSSSYFSALAVVNVVTAAFAGASLGAIVSILFTMRDGVFHVDLALAAAVCGLGMSYQSGLRRMLFARRGEAAAFALDAIYMLVLLSGLTLSLGGFVWTANSLLWLIAIASLASALPFTGLVFDGRAPARLIRAILRQHWVMSRWLLSTTIVTIGQEQAIWIIMGIVLGDGVVGSVRVGQYLFGLIGIPLTAMHNYVVRRAAEVYATGREAGLFAYLLRETLLLGALVAALVGVVAIPGSTWLHILFGVDDETALMVLRAFAAIYVMIFLRELWMFYLRTVNRTSDIFNAMAISSVLAGLSAYPATVTFGAAGAVAVIAAANALSMLLVLAAVQRHLTAAGVRIVPPEGSGLARLMKPLAR